jgi:hypothetical protein
MKKQIEISDVCAYGLKSYSEYDEETRNEKPCTKQIELARAFLKLFFRRSQNAYKKATSYGLKHTVERYCEHYISNGAFITAALLEGYIVSVSHYTSPNVYIHGRYKTKIIHDALHAQTNAHDEKEKEKIKDILAFEAKWN